MPLDRKPRPEHPFIPASRVKPGASYREPDALHNAPISSDRRSACRYPAATAAPRVWLAAAGDPDSAIEVSILDLSHFGAMIGTDRVPGGRSIWLRIEPSDAEPSDWFSASVVESRAETPGSSRQVLRVRFPDGCPYEVFKSTIWGR